jgi:hypothetical protein
MRMSDLEESAAEYEQAVSYGEDDEATELHLELKVSDREVRDALLAIENEAEREDYALTALRLGIMALQRARGEIDAGKLKQQGERIMSDLEKLLIINGQSLVGKFQEAFQTYFDPQSGHFQARIEKLVSHDGELATLLKEHVGGDNSEMAKTMAVHLGEASPIFKLVNPEDSEGLAAKIQESVSNTLTVQREGVLAEFSLDNRESALSRLVGEITDRQGKLRKDFAQDIQSMVGQFSLDNKDSALSRLVRHVEHSQKTIVSQFSLDEETSALSRLQREVTAKIQLLSEQQGKFQTELATTLAALSARKQAEAKGTRHGLDFEDAVGALIQAEAQSNGDLFESTGNTTGAIRNCKKGDQLVTLGPDSPGAGRRVVFEAKEDQSYTDVKALEELDEAKRNRGAEVGVFVWSKKVAPADTPTFRRIGDDLVVVWDVDAEQSDVLLRAAVSVAKALVAQNAAGSAAKEIPLEEMQKSVNRIIKQAGKFEDINRWGETIRNSADKILDQVRIMSKELAGQSEELNRYLVDVREALAE